MSQIGDQHSDRQQRRGHTLFEVLLALGLSLVLLSAVYTALDMHWRYSVAGQRQTEQLQVARALFELMSDDVRCVVFRADDADTTTIPTDVTRIEVIQVTDRYSGRSIGVVGDEEKMWLHTAQTIPRIGMNEGLSQTPRVSIVRWSVVTAGNAGIQAEGLARIVDSQVAGDDGTSGRTTSEILAREVDRIRFRYFDGSRWVAQWDSVASQRLPKAVEITISFPAVASGEEAVSTEHRLVIPLPGAEA